MKCSLFIIALFSFGSVFAEPQVNISIIQARQKASQKNRAEAIQILNQAIKIEKNEAKAKELMKERIRLANLFFTNEGQRFFELGESIRYSEQSGFQSKYDDALKLEGNNWRILVSQAIGQIKTKDCKAAKATLLLADEMIPDTEEGAILSTHVAVCLNEDLSQIGSAIRQPSKANEGIRLTLIAKIELALGDEGLALQRAREAALADKDYPGAYYVAWSILKKENNAGLDEAQRYLSLCKSATQSNKRKYFLDAEFCSDTTAVENYIKTVENASL